MTQHKRKNHHLEDILISAIVQGMQEKKAQDISILNLQSMGSTIAAYFILCTGQAKKQVEAITETIIEMVYKKAGQRPWKQEGLTNKEWVLLDYVDVVVHVFHSDKRAFYALDTLWGDVAITHIKDWSFSLPLIGPE